MIDFDCKILFGPSKNGLNLHTSQSLKYQNISIASCCSIVTNFKEKCLK